MQNIRLLRLMDDYNSKLTHFRLWIALPQILWEILFNAETQNQLEAVLKQFTFSWQVQVEFRATVSKALMHIPDSPTSILCNQTWKGDL